MCWIFGLLFWHIENPAFGPLGVKRFTFALLCECKRATTLSPLPSPSPLPQPQTPTLPAKESDIAWSRRKIEMDGGNRLDTTSFFFLFQPRWESEREIERCMQRNRNIFLQTSTDVWIPIPIPILLFYFCFFHIKKGKKIETNKDR